MLAIKKKIEKPSWPWLNLVYEKSTYAASRENSAEDCLCVFSCCESPVLTHTKGVTGFRSSDCEHHYLIDPEHGILEFWKNK